MRACREMGIRTVAVHSTADDDAMHVRLADEAVCIGPAPAKDSYLNKAAILSAATITGADAIHPGYGFLSENADFAEIVEEHGITFIGPTPDHIRMMGDKITAKQAAMIGAACPACRARTGAHRQRGSRPSQSRRSIGYPVLIKATAGGGGKGMKVARNAERADRGLAASPAPRPRPPSAIADVYMEKYLGQPRHIEMQILGRQLRRGGASGRARLLAAAPPPEGAGGGALASAQRRPARQDRRDRLRGHPPAWATATPAPSSSCSRTASSISSR